jgi:hypothetical protein
MAWKLSRIEPYRKFMGHSQTEGKHRSDNFYKGLTGLDFA